ncbi:transcription repressor OFP13 isoform X1 [Zea mays]|jgi:uncharacterized protein (TIGR01568 family)|uniref:Transcription repressor n=1 Tax=Zea mays TaxID=4577 RepID=B4FZ20_MAIZE|eukprot:NP_001141949.1 plant-specific domain TIGR01568 family protein [Zea mays]
MVTRRLALSSLFHGKARDTSSLPPPPPPPPAPAWPWPSSKNPRTTQPQAAAAAAAAGARTVASIVLDSADSSFTASSALQEDCCCSDSLSTASEASASASAACDDAAADDAVVVRGVRSDRLLFDPGASATNSILEEKSATKREQAFGGAVAVAFESADPYVDFRASMEEMVAAHGIGRHWGWLEEMLGWYLRANDGDTHCAIVAAFIDVVVVAAVAADPARSSQQASSRTSFATGELEVADKGKPDGAGALAVSCLD